MSWAFARTAEPQLTGKGLGETNNCIRKELLLDADGSKEANLAGRPFTPIVFGGAKGNMLQRSMSLALPPSVDLASVSTADSSLLEHSRVFHCLSAGL
jgi:hypothetical protein